MVALTVLAASGYARGPVTDVVVTSALHSFQEWLRVRILTLWMIPPIAAGVMVVLRYLTLVLLLALIAGYVYRIPCFIGHIVFGEFDRRRGRRLAGLGLLFGLSLPISLTLALCSYSEASLYAWFHFVLGFAFIRFAIEPSAMNSTLNWHARIRTAIDNSADEDGEEVEAETEPDDGEE